MNKQELIKEYENIVKDDSLELCGCYNMADKNFMRKIYKSVLEDLERLDEPEKVTVPQFVSDWYEENKDDFEGNLFRCAHNIPSTFDGAKLNEFERWFLNASIKAFQILVNMHQFGYTVEKEKRYSVKIKGEIEENLLVYGLGINRYFLARTYDSSKRNEHTRKELEEAGFGWVFDCEGIEIEEVEE